MKAVINQLPTFVAKWRGLGLTDDDLRFLEAALMANPEAGPVMRRTGGLRKARFAPPSWHAGKSGAARVCYAYFPKYERFYLVTLFAKKDKANLTEAECNAVARILRGIQDRLDRGTAYA